MEHLVLMGYFKQLWLNKINELLQTAPLTLTWLLFLLKMENLEVFVNDQN